MKLKPYLSAAGAVAYIGVVVLFMHYIETLRHDTPDTILDGLGFISLFVFSAAVMAFLFFYQPALLLIENKKTEAVSYFLKTLLTFGIVTALVLTFVSLQ
jgi:hypothetical protein